MKFWDGKKSEVRGSSVNEERMLFASLKIYLNNDHFYFLKKVHFSVLLYNFNEILKLVL